MNRLRIIAGPNGSGKTTLTKDLHKNYNINFGYYINADDIEKILKEDGEFRFNTLHLKITEPVFNDFFKNHVLHNKCIDVEYIVKRNTLFVLSGLKSFSYFTALLADFIRHQVLQSGQTFTFETVMSGKDKLTFLQTAKDSKYRVYLYYICTDNVLINKYRVADRVEKGGHPVPADKIEKRYKASLSNLLDVIKLTNRAYLFDNSGTEYKLVAQVTDGRDIDFDPAFVPNWFVKYVLNKLK